MIKAAALTADKLFPKILSVSGKTKAIMQSLLTPVEGKTLANLKSIRLDNAKYKHSAVGHPVPEFLRKNVIFAWCCRRKDKDGVYWRIMCATRSDNPAWKRESISTN